MKGQIKSMRLILVILFSTLFLQACGGSSDKAETFTVNASVSTVGFSNEFLQQEAQSFAVDVTFNGSGLLLGFAPTAQPVSWLNYRIENLTDNSATIHIDVVDAQLLNTNLYTTTLRLTSGNTTTSNYAHADIDISLLIWQTLTFDETYGVDVISSKSIDFSTIEDDLTFSSSVPWLNVDKNFSDGITTLTVSPTMESFTEPGLYNGEINIVSAGQTITLPVELSLDNIYLFADKATIALAKTSNINNSQTTININSNSILPWGWQASTNAAWLTLTPNTETNQLLVSADSSALANNTTAIAEITISPDSATTAITETIQVSFYKSDLASEVNSLAIVTNSNGVVIDPLLPYYYVATLNELRRYHLYSNELLSSTVIAPENTLLEQLIIHPDASVLLAKAVETTVIDENTTQTNTRRYKVNLNDMSVIELTDVDITNEPVKFVRLEGRYFVATSILEFADENLTRIAFDANNAFFARAFNVAAQSQSIFALDISTTDELMSIKRLSVSINDYASNPITTQITHSYRPELLASNDQISDFFVSADEKNIYAISPTSEWISFDGTTFTDNGVLNSDVAITNLALAHTANDRPHYVRFDANTGFKIDVYNHQQIITNTIALGESQPNQLLIANGDSRAVFISQDDASVTVINLAQFSSSSERLLFKTNFGDSDIAQQTLTFENIDTNWQASASEPWLILTEQRDGNSQQLLVDIDRSLITEWGKMTSTISVFDPASNTTKLISIELAIDAIRLSSNYTSLAFNSLSTQQTLVHTVDILTNSESNISWQASTDVNWLSLSTNSTNNTLTITGLPANIANDGIHNAVINLSPINANSAISSTINVTFNKGSVDSTSVDISSITYNTSGVALDPMRPYVYIASGDTLNTYHVITGALVNTTFSPLVNVDLTHLVVHPDGSILLASNTENYLDDNGAEQSRINHYQFDLTSYQFSQLNSENITIDFRPIMIKMVAGAPVVITQALEYADLNLVRQYWDENNAFLTATLAQAQSTNTIMAHNQSAGSIERFTLSYNAYASSMVSAVVQPSYTSATLTNTASLAMNTNGSVIYTANNTSEWASFDGTTYTDNGLLQANNDVESFKTTTDTNNNSYFYRFDPTIGVTYSKYSNTQIEQWTKVITGASAQSFLMPAYQRLLTYDATTSTLKLRSHP